MKLKELPKEERPRERLKKYGVEALSTLELLQILIKSGTKEIDVKKLSEEVLVLLEASQLPTYQELEQIKGLGEAKALSLIATLELGKRLFLSPPKPIVKITSPKIAYLHTKRFFYQKKQECFYCIYVDARKQILGEKMLFKGTINKSTVHPREVFKEAYRLGAAGIICLHNHPSGDITPSKMDCIFTEKLVEIGKIQGLPILDHIIVSEKDYYSFQERCEI